MSRSRSTARRVMTIFRQSPPQSPSLPAPSFRSRKPITATGQPIGRAWNGCCVIAFITDACCLGEPPSPARLLRSRAPPLWEMQGAPTGEDDTQAQSAPGRSCERAGAQAHAMRMPEPGVAHMEDDPGRIQHTAGSDQFHEDNRPVTANSAPNRCVQALTLSPHTCASASTR
jgi:hypothetical protein